MFGPSLAPSYLIQPFHAYVLLFGLLAFRPEETSAFFARKFGIVIAQVGGGTLLHLLAVIPPK